VSDFVCNIDLGSGEGEEDDDDEGREGARTYCILRDKLLIDSHRTWIPLGELIGKVWSLLRGSCDYRFFLLPAIGVWKPTMTEKSSIETDAWEDRYWRDPFEPGLVDADVSLGISALRRRFVISHRRNSSKNLSTIVPSF
jgi:hypothetical protein